MKHFLLILLILTGCSTSKYQVVDKLEYNLYHLHNPKTNNVEIISTNQKLIMGKWYKLKTIEIINENEDDN
jgi:hypothetical protein